MAITTIITSASMGGHTTKHHPSLGIEITRTEHGITRDNLNGYQDDQSDESADQSKGGKTTKAHCVHLSSVA
jgi:hypothetical protein